MVSDHIPKASMTEGPVGRLLAQLTIPMIFGIVSIMLFNVVDALFVGQLGTKELAAISFTFPLAFIMISILMGLGVGTSSVLARAIGAGDSDRVRHITTWSLVLTLIVTLSLSTIGRYSVLPIFRLLGADDALLPLIDSYMQLWYGGLVLLGVPMISNSAIRATGNMQTPSKLMMTSALINAVLDPILIFGYAGFPKMGLEGAALATVISWAVVFLASLWVICFKLNLLDLHRARFSEVMRSWKAILSTGVPAAGSNVLVPLSSGIITALVATHGPEAVAAWGVGTRLEPLALVVVMALASVMTPFVGQNWGAGKHDRVKTAMRRSLHFAILWGVFACMVLIVSAQTLAGIFTEDDQISTTIVSFLWTVPVSYGFQGVTLVVCSGFNAIRRARYAILLHFTRLFALCLPLAYLGSLTLGVHGIFMGTAAANILIGLIAYYLGRRSF